MDRKDLLTPKVTTKKRRLPLIVTYNQTLPNINEIIKKHWNILKINPILEKVFSEKPVVAFRRGKNLQQIIGGQTIANNQVLKRNTKNTNGHCVPCYADKRTKCCNQITKTTTFFSQQTKRTFTILHKVNCKSSFVIYLLECQKCKIQYVGKAETEFHLRLNNHRKDVHKADSIPASRHFAKADHNFNKDAKFTIIEEIRSKTLSKEAKKELLKQRENFWILKLETLTPKGLNHELN